MASFVRNKLLLALSVWSIAMLLSIKAVALGMSTLLACQVSTPGVIYIESWKKGARQVQQRMISVDLNPTTPEYETFIKDKFAKATYKLSLFPGYGKDPLAGIVEWMVELVELRQRPEVNLLKPSNDPEQDFFTAVDSIGWLYPLENPRSVGAESAVVPFLATRVVKVEDFFCTIHVKRYRFSPNKKGVLDSITVEIRFTNEPPTVK